MMIGVVEHRFTERIDEGPNPSLPTEGKIRSIEIRHDWS
jgi:hypothetical protein